MNVMTGTDFEHAWRRRFEQFAGQHDDDAGIAGWTATGLRSRFQRFRHLWDAVGPPEPLQGAWLDAGCGAGTYTRFLLERNLRVTAVDYSVLTANKARQRCDAGANWAAADVTHLPFGAASFDGALCFGVMQALSSPTEALLELRRVLRRGGSLWVDALNARCFSSVVLEQWRRLKGRPRHLRYDLAREFRSALRSSGFDAIDIDWVPILPSKLRAVQRLMEGPAVCKLLKAQPGVGSFLSHSMLARARAA